MAKVLKGAGCGFEQVVQTRQDRRNDTDRTLLNQLDRE